MKSRIIEQLKEKERQAFLKLTPVDRILKMEMLLYEVISIKAKEEGISKGEIYRRYINRDKKRRHEV
ncbi:MAG TPA: hypothetical protein DCQ99_02750 [Nitrospinae bacterium]|nr:hypothetical protein [Nitrospinota bacterium]HBA26513.1 hypothetical protein [Nitrospinota bacterium]